MNDTAEYHHGDQEISEQLASYRAFDGLTKWGALAVATLVLMLTLWFCVGADFFGGAIPGVILAVAGIVFLRSKPAQDH